MENKPKKELLFSLTRKDFIIKASASGGPGGQNVNKRRTKCQITHPPSGASGQSSDEREYKQNEKIAFRRLIESPKFKVWHKIEVAHRIGLLKAVDKIVEQQMKEVKVEVKDEKGRWVDEKERPIDGTKEEVDN